MNIFHRVPKFDFMGKRGIFFTLSLCITVGGLIVTFWRGPSLLSEDFTGGYLSQLQFSQPIDVGEIRTLLITRGYSDVSLQRVGEQSTRIIIKTKKGGGEIIPIIKEAFPNQAVEVLGEEQISPTMGQTIRKQTIIGCLVAMLGILVYIAARFEFRFAVGAIVALIHDLLVALALLAITGRQVDSLVIAAFLTILGYSVNDTVIIFDRIRENLRGLRKVEDPTAIFNRSINETLSRTTITVLTVLLVTLCLFIWGGPVLNNFSFVLLVGFITGTYSSIFIASAIVIAWEKKSPHRFRT
ncbi:MAG: protein translocase subunit SecF [Candidatus Omnitrophica bacterium]|nr:protein translocase subunit SecF [Candidatus Omnitrophota bacterium]